jgi:hypothetical protein
MGVAIDLQALVQLRQIQRAAQSPVKACDEQENRIGWIKACG